MKATPDKGWYRRSPGALCVLLRDEVIAIKHRRNLVEHSACADEKLISSGDPVFSEGEKGGKPIDIANINSVSYPFTPCKVCFAGCCYVFEPA